LRGWGVNADLGQFDDGVWDGAEPRPNGASLVEQPRSACRECRVVEGGNGITDGPETRLDFFKCAVHGDSLLLKANSLGNLKAIDVTE